MPVSSAATGFVIILTTVQSTPMSVNLSPDIKQLLICVYMHYSYQTRRFYTVQFQERSSLWTGNSSTVCLLLVNLSTENIFYLRTGFRIGGLIRSTSTARESCETLFEAKMHFFLQDELRLLQ